MKLFGVNQHWATRRTHPGAHPTPEEKPASGQMQCRTLYIALGLILLSCALFVGTTFAWFSDNSTGATAQIVGGKLSVALVFDDDTKSNFSLDSIPMTCRKDSKSGENVWNPGDTFETPRMHVVNTGDLPIAYKLVLDPADELEDAVTFVIVDQNDYPISETEIFQLPAPADTKSASYGPSFKIVGTVKENIASSFSETTLEKPFRLIVLARQPNVPYDVKWPAYCTDADHKAWADENPLTHGEWVVNNGTCSYVCSQCGEELKPGKDHSALATALYLQYKVGKVFVRGDLTGSDNSYTKILTCDDCGSTIGTLHVTTEPQEPDEETVQPAEPTEIITSVSFDYSDPSIVDYYLESPAQP